MATRQGLGALGAVGPSFRFGTRLPRNHKRLRDATLMSDWRKSVSAITLFVEDKNRAKSFYEKVFELQPAHEDETEVMFRLADTLLFLTNASVAHRMIAPAVVGSPDQGPRHVFAIIVEDVDAVCGELKEKGVGLLNGPEDRLWGMRTANFQDPDGHVWEIATELQDA